MPVPARRPALLAGGLAVALAGLTARYWSSKRQAILARSFPLDTEDAARLRALTANIVDEAIKAFGFPLHGWQPRLLGPALRVPSGSFARLALGLDRRIEREGLGPAFGQLLAYAVRDPQVYGAEALPRQGPVLLLSNHPGAYDVPLLVSNLPRNDVQLVISTLPLTEHLPAFRSHMIEVTRDPRDGMRGLRQSIRHLRAGGVLQIFPSGIVDPDPDVLPGAQAALADWRPGVDMMLRKVPEAQIVVAIISGVISPSWLRSPLLRLQPEIWRQRKLAEFLQIMQQVTFPGTLLVTPRLSFAPPIRAAELTGGNGDAPLHELLIRRAEALLDQHMAQVASARTPPSFRCLDAAVL